MVVCESVVVVVGVDDTVVGCAFFFPNKLLNMVIVDLVCCSLSRTEDIMKTSNTDVAAGVACCVPFTRECPLVRCVGFGREPALFEHFFCSQRLFFHASAGAPVPIPLLPRVNTSSGTISPRFKASYSVVVWALWLANYLSRFGDVVQGHTMPRSQFS